MSNENSKDFNAMLNNSKDMPKTQIVKDEKTIKKYGGTKMFFAPPIFYDDLMKKVPRGKLITISQMRNFLAKQNYADFTDSVTAGIFVNIVAWASYQRNENITPFWRTLKSDGELNAKYPEAISLQKKLLEEEGHTIISKGKKNIKYYVQDFEKSLVELKVEQWKNGMEIICGKYLYFGSYPQNGSEKEPILWRILKIENNIATLITDKILINTKYDEYYSDYKISAIRKYIHNEFIPMAFTEEELERILPTELESVTDKVYLPSADDIRGLSREERIRKITPFARLNEASGYPDSYKDKTIAGNGWYWTRTPWKPPYNPTNNHEILYVEYDGSLTGRVPNGYDIGMVPMIRIKIDE